MKPRTGLDQGQLFKPRPPELRLTYEDLFPGEGIFDNFAGGGGISTGTVQATGRPVDAALNHDPEAIAMHRANHPETRHYCEDITEVDPVDVAGGRPVGLVWFAPDCTHFSKSKGAQPLDNKRRGLANVVIDWARKVKPRIIMLENVEEFEDWGPLREDGRPDRERLGQYFRPWLASLIDAGYHVEFRCLVAADYGAPTKRKRFFLVARRDRRPIVWPEPTHGEGRPAPWRAAAEIIDWSIPTRSIFGRPKSLAEATERRLALGVHRFVVEDPDPFVIRYDADSLIAPFIIRHGHGHTSKKTGAGIVPGKGMPGVFRGQRLGVPLGTITTRDDKDLAVAFLTKHYGGKKGHQTPGSSLRSPTGTITARDHHSLTVGFLTKFYGTSTGSSLRQPVPTITGQGQHIGAVAAFLTKYYSASGRVQGQSARAPLHTITTKARFGLVTIASTPYQVTDLGMRMLKPHELFAASDFPDDYIIDPEFNGKTLTQEAQVRLCGDAAPPCYARALVQANARKAA